MSLFFVDSASDLPKEILGQMGIECIYLPYCLGKDTLQFSDEFDFGKFYSKSRKGLLPQIKSLSKQEYIDIFEPALKSGDDVAYIHSSGNLMETSSLQSAREMLTKKYKDRKFILLDSKNISSGQGVLSFLLGMEYLSGEGLEKIESDCETLRDEIAFLIAVDSVDGLTNAGLLDAQGFTTGSSLNIKLILAIDIDGRVRIVDRVSGRKKAIAKLIEIVRQTGENVADFPIGVCSAGNVDDRQELVSKLKEYFGADAKIMDENISPSNCSLFGLGAIGIAFHIHKKMH